MFVRANLFKNCTNYGHFKCIKQPLASILFLKIMKVNLRNSLISKEENVVFKLIYQVYETFIRI
jgi:hypothetical protein